MTYTYSPKLCSENFYKNSVSILLYLMYFTFNANIYMTFFFISSKIGIFGFTFTTLFATKKWINQNPRDGHFWLI